MLDLVRLGVFSKNAVDLYKLQCTLLVRAIGTCLTFYFLQKENPMMIVELDGFVFPTTINSIPGIFGYLERIALIVSILRSMLELLL